MKLVLTLFERSILKPVSLSALSVQLKSILVLEMAVADRLLGAAGTAGAGSVVALAGADAVPTFGTGVTESRICTV